MIDEIDRRQTWAERGYSSMFDMCTKRFHMSEPVAGKRIGVARLAHRFPLVFSMIGRGEIHMSGVLRLKTLLTEENHASVLAQAKHKSLAQIDNLRASLAPRPDVASRVRVVPRRAIEVTLTPTERIAEGPQASCATSERAAAESRRPKRSPDPEPLAPQRYKLTVTIDEGAHLDLGQLQDLLAHQIPNGDPAAIVQRALSLLLEQTLKRKAAITERARKTTNTTNAMTDERVRAIPAAVRRTVWKRDEGRCGFVSVDGRRCGETRRVEFAHVEAWAKGGGHSVANVELRCRAHNDLEAVRDYGELFMSNKRRHQARVREEAVGYARTPMIFTCRAASTKLGERRMLPARRSRP
ncbi:MAG: hypothetical protein DRJ42_01105 [Deltaproteobacteria bacterium]|nr:MAG: hypothetical protein DRJ42_01105 [Deltaproteobacteria bacterium]